jgi:RNA polymerase sigma-70 factor (ECF subfamily)
MKPSREQFNELVLGQLDTLYGMALRLTGDSVDAEDLVQETCLRACRAFDRFELQSYGVRPWLLRIMHNLHLNRVRQAKNQAKVIEDNQLDDEVPSPLPAPWMCNRSLESVDQRIIRALKQLSDETRAVVLMWAIEGLSYQEIAIALSIPVGTVMSRLHRGRKQLERALVDFAQAQRVVARCA